MNSKPIGCVGNGKAIGRIDISERVKICGLYKTDKEKVEEPIIDKDEIFKSDAYEGEPLEALTVKQLKEKLDSIDINYGKKDTKVKLIAKFK